MNTAQALNLASELRSQINELDSIVNEGVRAAEKQGGKTMQARYSLYIS